MTIQSLYNNAASALKRNSPTVLTGVGVSGVVVTAVLSARAMYKATKKIEALEAEYGHIEDRNERAKANFKETWPLFVAPTLAGAVTVGCIVGSNRVSTNRTAAAVTAAAISQKAFDEYRKKFIELHSQTKEEKLRTEIVKDKIKNAVIPPEMREQAASDQRKVDEAAQRSEIFVLGPGNVRCCEIYTSRYFMSDKEAIKRAENLINATIIRQNYVSLSHFYELIKLKNTQMSDDLGWSFEDVLTLKFYTIEADDGVPVLAFEYDPPPHMIHS